MDVLAEITQHLLRSSPDALVVIDDHGLIQFANDTVTELFGYPSSALIGRQIDVLVPERLRTQHVQHIAGYVKEPRKREMGATITVLFARRADGSEFAAHIRLAPFNIGERLFVAAAIRDSTERQRINEALIVAREEADRANKAKSRFLATASHDLRQPLQAVRLLNSAMSRLTEDARVVELLQHQATAIESATRLLNALLDISRLESGAIEPQHAAVSLPDIFHQLRSEFASFAAARGLSLQVSPLPVTVTTDRTLFYQLLQNLVGNAIKYTDHGCVSVTCTSDADELRIRIRDTGIGIPSDKLERIFDEYYQVDNHGAKRVGVGLGLAIVKEVSRLLDFKVHIASTVGQSTDAVISIPVKFLSAASAAVTRAAIQSAPVRDNKGRIILVEDNEGVRVATELFLKLEGYETCSASSFADAQRLLMNIRAGDIVIADYHLNPTHTGLDVLSCARRHAGRDVPGIILSGDLPYVLRSVKTPVPNARFLSKPVDTKVLLEAISDLTGW